MKILSLLPIFSILFLMTSGPLHADSMLAKKKESCGCGENCGKKQACAVHKHKECDCS